MDTLKISVNPPDFGKQMTSSVLVKPKRDIDISISEENCSESMTLKYWSLDSESENDKSDSNDKIDELKPPVSE